MPPLDDTQIPDVDPQTAAHDRATAVYNGMLDRGMDKPTALGWAANAMVESKADPTGPRSSSGAAGTFQWVGPRLEAYRALHGHEPEEGTLDEHLDHVVWENQNIEQPAWQAVQRAAPDPASKAAAIRTAWERPGTTPDEVASEAQKARDAARGLSWLIGNAHAEAPQQPPIAAQVQAARKAGYNDGEIADYLRQSRTLGPAIDTARKAGYSDPEIFGHYGLKLTPPEPVGAEGGTWDTDEPAAAKAAYDPSAPGFHYDPAMRQMVPNPPPPGQVGMEPFHYNTAGAQATPTPPSMPGAESPLAQTATEFGPAPQIAPQESAVSVGERAYQAAKQAFQETPSLLDPRAQAIMDRIQEHGGVKGFLAQLGSTAVMDLDYLNAASQAAFKGGQEFAQAALERVPGVGEQGARDIAAMPEAFMGSPHVTGIPHVEPLTAPEAAAMREARGLTNAPLTVGDTAVAAGQAEREAREAWRGDMERQMAARGQPGQLALPNPEAPAPVAPREAAPPAGPARPQPAAVPPVPPKPPDSPAMTQLKRMGGLPTEEAPAAPQQQPPPVIPMGGPPPAPAAPPTPEPPPAYQAPANATPFAPVPKEPTRLAQFLRQDFTVGRPGDINTQISHGGLRDPGGDLAAIAGGNKARGALRSILGGGNGYRSLINNETGSHLDDATLRAWKAGYFPEHDQRPAVNDLLDKLDEDINRGNPQYSHHDQDAAVDYNTALAHNSEIDRLAAEHGLPTRGITRAQFFDQITDHLSQEDAAAEHDQIVAQHQDAYDRWTTAARQLGEDPEDYTPRTLEELEDEHRQADAAEAAGAVGPRNAGPEPAGRGAGTGEGGAGQRGRGAEPAGRTPAQSPGAARELDQAAAFREELPEGLEEQTGYHGTPHDFERFDTARIGTGEGAQAYGHGLYFAENPGVAGSYRDKLSGNSRVPGSPEGKSKYSVNGTYPPEGQAGHTALDTALDIDGVLGYLHMYETKPGAFGHDYRPSYQQSIDYLRSRIEQRIKSFREQLGGAKPNGMADRDMAALADYYDQHVKGAAPQDIAERPPGHLLTVRINAEPEEMLDWDKPLSEQSPQVKEALQKLPEALKDRLTEHAENHGLNGPLEEPENYTGGQFIRSASHYNVVDAPEDLSDELRKVGIKGIRYLDQGSRRDGDGSRNIVVFDHNDIEITHRNGQPVAPRPMTGLEAGRMLAGQEAEVGRRLPTPTPAGPDLFGATRAQPVARVPEPTIRNDPRQQTLEGMEPTAKQAQAASDAAGPKGNQEPANQGLFAPKEAEQPELAPRTSRWLTSSGENFQDQLHQLRAAGHQTAADWVLDQGRATGHEHLAVVDNHTGEIVHAGTNGQKDRAGFRGDNGATEPDRYTIHHNHPNDTALSAPDISMLANPGVSHVVAHGHDGTTTFASIGPKFAATRNPSRAQISMNGSVLRNAYNQALPHAERLLRTLITDGKITIPEANHVYADVANRLLQAHGVINYASTVELPAPVREAFGQLLEKLKLGPDVFDRSSVAVRPEERIAGLPAPLSERANEGPAGGARSRAPGEGVSGPAQQELLEGKRLAERQTDTPEFRRWFGDSKVVDAEGKPLVVYHGTNSDFAAFDRTRAGANTMHPTSRLGFWFSDDPATANLFTQRLDDSQWPYRLTQQPNAQTMPVHLSIKKPFEMTVEQFRNIQAHPYGEHFESEQPEAAQRVREWMDKQKQLLLDRGYDGIHVTGDPKYADILSGEEYAHDAWVAFRPEQIKSAIGNRGTFDPNDTNMLHAGDELPPERTPEQERAIKHALRNGPLPPRETPNLVVHGPPKPPSEPKPTAMPPEGALPLREPPQPGPGHNQGPPLPPDSLWGSPPPTEPPRPPEVEAARITAPSAIKNLNVVENLTIFPRTLASLDDASARFLSTWEARARDETTNVAQLRGVIQPNFLKLSKADRLHVAGALEVARVEGAENLIQNADGTITARNTSNPTARWSKVGDELKLTPQETAAYHEAVQLGKDQWTMLMQAAAKRYGWGGSLDPAAIRAEAESRGEPGDFHRLSRLADLLDVMKQHEQDIYFPMQRFGSYFVAIRPKHGQEVVANQGGHPPLAWFETVEKPAFQDLLGTTQGATSVKAVATKRIAELEKQFPPDQFDYQQGDWISHPNLLRQINIPAVEKLFMLMENRAKAEIQKQVMQSDNPPTTKQGIRAEAKNRYDELHGSTLEAFYDALFDQLKAGYRHKARVVPGYSDNFDRAISSHLYQIGRNAADTVHRDGIESEFQNIQDFHPHQNVKNYWKQWRAYQEDPGSPLSHAADTLNQIGFAYMLGMNPSSTMVIAMHTPMTAAPVLSVGVGPRAAVPLLTRGLARAYGALRFDTVHGGHIDLDKAMAGMPDDKQAFLQKMASEGRLAAVGTHDMAALNDRMSGLFGDKADYFRRGLEIATSNVHAVDQANRFAVASAAWDIASDRTRFNAAATPLMQHNALFRNMVNREGLSPETYGRFMLSQAAFDWGKQNKAPIMRGPLGTLMFSLHGFQTRYLSTALNLAKNSGPSGRLSFMLMMGALGLGAGALGLPGSQDAMKGADAVWKYFTDRDPHLQFKLHDAIQDSGLGQTGADMILQGPLSTALGVNLGSRIGFGDVLSREFESSNVIGTIPSIMWGAYAGAHARYETGQPAAAVAAEAAPGGVRGPLRALAESQQGVVSRKGVPQIAPEDISAADLAKTAAGFQPLSVAHYQEEMSRYYGAPQPDAWKAMIKAGETEDAVKEMVRAGWGAQRRREFIQQTIRPPGPSRQFQRFEQQRGVAPPP